MPRDYASKSSSGSSKGKQKGRKPQRQSSSRRWLLLLLLLVVVVVVVIVGFLFHSKHVRLHQNVVTKRGASVSSAQPTINKKAQSLKKAQEVNIVLRPRRITQISERPHYYELVVGTVDQLSQADEIRDRLDQLGYKVKMRQIEIDGKQRFRLKIGSYRTERLAARAQTNLQSNNVVTVIHPVY